ncbi:hypothetical protein D3C84_932040 [compost metagenome]
MPPIRVAGQNLVEPGHHGEGCAFDLLRQLAGGQRATASLIEQFAQALLQLNGLFLDGAGGNALIQVQAERQGFCKEVEQAKAGHDHSCACTGNSLMTSESGGRSVNTAMLRRSRMSFQKG